MSDNDRPRITGRRRGALAEYLARRGSGAAEQLPALFDWLGRWFSEPGFRGCAFINSFGELAATSPRIARVAAEHKSALREQLLELARQAEAEEPDALADRLLLLDDEAITNAAMAGSPAPAEYARDVAETLVAAAVRHGRGRGGYAPDHESTEGTGCGTGSSGTFSVVSDS